ncbi:MAG: chromosome segregation protein SMC [Dorea sp.]|nr:chromosome segregation protein SMC [Dorea sp.]
MYLKSIEVQGFKSFANKIRFEFHNGITGIVGPNGSGKSNVADAVRWVLGEQKVKQLRSGSMQDVIFSGTENRKPLGYASVAITLDNSDNKLQTSFSEVTVTRKLYRSGESEYLMNGVTCRLRDINELFYDTGIGKEGYSIIGQGQIDRILSGKPEERRELFEEAAGIVKFKRRKNMSLKKLEDERQNLLRVNDILAELEKQVGPLERQSEKAKVYLKKRDELKVYDINVFLMEAEKIKGQLEELENKLAIALHQQGEEEASYEKMKEEQEKLELELDEADVLLSESKDQLNKTNILKQQLENQISLLEEQIKSAVANDEHFALRSETVKTEIESRKDTLSQMEEEGVQILAQSSELKAKEASDLRVLTDLQEQIAFLMKSVEDKKNEIIDVLGNRASTKAQVQHYDTMMEQISVSRSRINQTIIENDSNILESQDMLENYQKDLAEVSAEIIAMTEQQKAYEARIHDLQSQITHQAELLKVGQTAYHREQSRLESLKNLTERYDGYGNSIRRVMDQKRNNPGILGVVADIIKVTKKYELAIEIALGGNIQNIVTSDEATAKRMIAYLKQNRFGRATFLPLTNIRNRDGGIRSDVLREEGVLGSASHLVTCEEQYKILAESLLGRTVVVDTLDHATNLARKYKQSLRIVTLEGELINPGGSLSGGAFKNNSNLLSRRREIEEFELTVKKLKQDMDEMEVSTASLREERAGIYEKSDALTEDLKTLFVKQNTAKMNVNQMLSLISTYEEAATAARNELADLEAQVQDIDSNKDSIHLELETSESLEKALNQRIEEAQIQLEGLRGQEEEKRTAFQEARLLLASLEQRGEFLSENQERVAEEIEKLEKEAEELFVGRQNAAADIEKKRASIENLKGAIEDSAALFEEIKDEIQEYTEKKNSLNQKLRKLMHDREDISKSLADLGKEIYRMESQKENLEAASEKQINYMWEEYELTYNMAIELKDAEMTNLPQMKKRITEIKAEIKALGSVNVNAIEEYKEVSERYTFLKKQHTDLVEAEAQLVKIVDELDTLMRKQFREQFKLIASEFDKVFKVLFGGGKGTLELAEDEDILEAGISIIAQPPGKKLQNMMQLSGGEKALTAISLLFAIQNLKPSPFCLLDEIEAALDDSNVTRFAQYLHKLTDHTQFIVITHRRGTMTAADRLYGITMQEKGVSTLVSVNLLGDDVVN